MRYFRLYEKLPGREPLGYSPSGTRWNGDGIPLIYASSSMALAMLEHYSIKGPVDAESSWELAELEVTGEVPNINADDLPGDWKKRPYPESTQLFGAFWATSRQTVHLAVPSIRIPLSGFPLEHNLLINPLHPDFLGSVSLIGAEDINFELNI